MINQEQFQENDTKIVPHHQTTTITTVARSATDKNTEIQKESLPAEGSLVPNERDEGGDDAAEHLRFNQFYIWFSKYRRLAQEPK